MNAFVVFAIGFLAVHSIKMFVLSTENYLQPHERFGYTLRGLAFTGLTLWGIYVRWFA